MSRTRKLALAGASVFALVGAGAAVAATTGHGHGGHPSARASGLQFNLLDARGHGAGWHGRGPGRGFGFGFGKGGVLQAAAGYLGVTAAQLQSDLAGGKTLAQVADGTSGRSASGLIQALVASEKSQLDAAVAAGKLTQAQEDAITANLQQRITDLVNKTRPAAPGFGRGFGFGKGGVLQAAAGYLGVTAAQLQSDLAGGKTLAQVADGTSGRSASGLIQALVASEKSQLDAAVAAGKLTQAQEDAITAKLQQRITDLVNGTQPVWPRAGGHRGWHGGGSPGGQGPTT